MSNKGNNYMFLNMSTLNATKRNYYFWNNGDGIRKEYSGISQLEPNTKLLIDRLSEKGERLDKIYVFCTGESVRQVPGVGKSAYQMYCDNIVEYLKDAGADYRNTFWASWKDRVNSAETEKIQLLLNHYCGESGEAVKNQPGKLTDISKKVSEQYRQESVTDNQNNDRWIKEYIDDQLYIRYRDVSDNISSPTDVSGLYADVIAGKEELFHLIEITDDYMKTNIERSCEVFGHIQASDHIYIDNKGGLRSSTFINNALMNILKIRNIRPEQLLDIKYNRDNFINELIDITEHSRLFDLISGFDEFIRHGSVRKFEDYYQELYSVDRPAQNPAEKSVIQAMRKISDAISICNVQGFFQSLENLKRAICQYRESDCEKDAIFEYFLTDIEKDYPMPTGNFPKDLLRAIRWCMEKGLLQQALTIVESKLPDYYVKSGILYYCKDEKQKSKLIKALKEKRNDLPKQKQYIFNDINHYFIKDAKVIYGEKEVIRGFDESYVFNRSYSILDKFPIADVQKSIACYKIISRVRNNLNHASIDEESIKKDIQKIIRTAGGKEVTGAMLNEMISQVVEECILQPLEKLTPASMSDVVEITRDDMKN